MLESASKSGAALRGADTEAAGLSEALSEAQVRCEVGAIEEELRRLAAERGAAHGTSEAAARQRRVHELVGRIAVLRQHVVAPGGEGM